MLTTFFTAVFTSTYWFGTWLNTTTLIALVALGATLALKSGNMNLGGESQIYLGGFVTALWLNAFLPATTENPSFFYIIIVFTSGFLIAIASGIIVTLPAALLKNWHGINEMISTFLFSSALIPILDYAITSTFRDKNQNLLATPEISDSFKLAHLLPVSDFNISFLFLIALIILTSIYLYKTKNGFKLRICGTAPQFAFYSGYNTSCASAIGMSFSGALHSITGFIAVVGTYYACYQNFYLGMGWNGLTIALIARSNPIFVFPISLLLSFIFTSSDAVMLTSSTSFDFESIVQGFVLLLVSVQIVKRTYTNKKERKK